MKLKFTVEVEVERTQGKFASKDDIAEQIKEAIEQADPSEVTVEDSTYEVQSFEVTHES